MKRFLLIAALLPALCFSCFAQRTAQGEMALSANFVTPLRAGWGASVEYNYYTIGGFWDAEIALTKRNIPASRENEQTFDTDCFTISPTHITARAGYMARLLSTRDRVFNIYAGGGILLGAGLCSTNDKWAVFNDQFGTEYYGTLSYFLYGVYPKIELEAFFSDTIALDLAFRAPLTIHTTEYTKIQTVTGLIYPELSAGIKLNF